MKKMTAEDYDGYIVRKDGKYLQAAVVNRWRQLLTIRWSVSAWDAWWTADRADAEKIAECVGGQIVGFNTVTGRFAS